MTEWKKPTENPKLPESLQKILDGLEGTKKFVESLLEKELQNLDKANQQLAKLEKRKSSRNTGKNTEDSQNTK